VRARLTPEAQADLAEARLWYRDRGSGLDQRFLYAVEACLRAISEYPERGSLIEPPIRRILLRGFPYALFYVLREDEAVVLGCLHGARSPRVWRRRGAS
jgi:plasmid stabilization system protein ParE